MYIYICMFIYVCVYILFIYLFVYLFVSANIGSIIFFVSENTECRETESLLFHIQPLLVTNIAIVSAKEMFKNIHLELAVV